jgi:hypothetical protein
MQVVTFLPYLNLKPEMVIDGTILNRVPFISLIHDVNCHHQRNDFTDGGNDWLIIKTVYINYQTFSARWLKTATQAYTGRHQFLQSTMG